MLTRQGAAKTIIPQEQKVSGQVFNMAGAEPSPDGKSLVVLWNGLEHEVENGKPMEGITADGKMETARHAHRQTLAELWRLCIRTGIAVSRRGLWNGPCFPRTERASPQPTTRALFRSGTRLQGRKFGQVSGTRVGGNSTTVAFANPISGQGQRVAFAPDNGMLAVSRDDGSLYLYSLHSWLPVAQIGLAPTRRVNNYPQPAQPLQWLAFSPDGKTLYGFARFGADVLAWDVPKSP